MEIPALVRRGDGSLSDGATARLVAAGRLVPVLPGVHIRSDLAHDFRWRAAAAMRWRPDATLFGPIAAALTFWSGHPVDTIHVASRTTAQRSGYRFERRSIPPELLTYRGQARLTVPALTALDMAVATNGVSIDNVLRSRMARIEDLHAALAATSYRSGNRELRRLLLHSRAEPWSIAERLAHKILREAGIRGWHANHRINLRGQLCFLDICFEHLRLAIEIDGRQFHSAADVFENDRKRQNALTLAGWTVLRFTYTRIVTEPEQVLAEIRRAILMASERSG